jgi:PIN domain nuclease of toxin-antitoxin system
VILDTCALLWVTQGGGPLSTGALQRIDAAPVVYVAAISGFEIGIKVQKGKLHLPVPPADWFAAVLAHHHLEVLVLSAVSTSRRASHWQMSPAPWQLGVRRHGPGRLCRRCPPCWPQTPRQFGGESYGLRGLQRRDRHPYCRRAVQALALPSPDRPARRCHTCHYAALL